jgi:hypothetical protein
MQKYDVQTDEVITRLIKVYGERNTNTSHLSILIKKNFGRVLLRDSAPKLIQWDKKLIYASERLRDAYFTVTFLNNLGWKHRVAPPGDVIRSYERKKQRKLTVVTYLKTPTRDYCPFIADPTTWAHHTI